MSDRLPELPPEFVKEMEQLEAQVTLGGLMDVLIACPYELRVFLEEHNRSDDK